MKMNLRVLGILPVGLLLSACWGKEAPNHTVQYFLDNAQAREEMLAECEVKDDAITDANCLNANAAAQTVAREKNKQSEQDAVKSLYGDGS